MPFHIKMEYCAKSFDSNIKDANFSSYLNSATFSSILKMRAFYLKVIFTVVLFFFSVSGSPVNSTTIAIPEFDELEVKNSVSYSIVIVPCRRGFRKIRNKCRPVFSPIGDNDDSNVLSMLTL